MRHCENSCNGISVVGKSAERGLFDPAKLNPANALAVLQLASRIPTYLETLRCPSATSVAKPPQIYHKLLGARNLAIGASRYGVGLSNRS
jgi:hypothetical protein